MNKTTRICRTPDEVFSAGWEAAVNLPPLSPAQRTRIAALIGPYLRASIPAAVAEANAAAEEVA